MEPAEYPLPENEILLPENGADIENYTSIAFAKKMVEVRTAASMLHAYKMSYDTVLNTDTLKHRAFLAALLHYKDSLRVYIDKYRPYARLKKKFVPGSNGKKEYVEVIHHTTTSHFTTWERIKILFGKPVIVTSELYTTDEKVIIVGAKAISSVPALYEPTIKNDAGLSTGLSNKVDSLTKNPIKKV